MLIASYSYHVCMPYIYSNRYIMKINTQYFFYHTLIITYIPSLFILMGRQNCDSTVVHSSIALLQERFRQLERAKEMRQKRELLRMFSEAEQQVKPVKAFESSRPFFQSELILPPSEPLQGSRYLDASLQNKQTDLQNIETPDLENLWSKNTVMQITNDSDEPDIDTSLHL